MIYAIVFGPLLGACLLAAAGLLPGEQKRPLSSVLPIALIFVLTLLLPLLQPHAGAEIRGILTGGLSFRTGGLRSVYAVITAFMWLTTALFSLEYFEKERRNLSRYWFFYLFTLGAVEGVMLSADLMTAFLFFELLSFSSFTWVIHEETAEAVRAGYTYLFIAVIGGLVLFMGLLLLQNTAGTLNFAGLGRLFTDGSIRPEKDARGGAYLAAGICILFGFGAKAGMFPVHIWLPRAHPVAPSPASALLSGVLTKVGIYGILMTVLAVFPADRVYARILLAAGAVTMVLGAVLALFSVSLKRTLACSSMSQIGFILTGIGMMILLRSAGEEEAAVMTLGGVMLHMVNHSLIKLVLFMAAGVAVMRLHTQDLNDLRGWGRNKLLLKVSFALGSLGISGIPLFDGYISKTLLHEGIAEGIHAASAAGSAAWTLHILEWAFLLSGGLTFAYMLKLFVCIFCEKNTDAARQARYDAEPHCMNRVSAAVIFGPACLMAVMGQPGVMNRLAFLMTEGMFPLSFRPFTLQNLKGGGISLAAGAVVYLLFVRKVILRENNYRDLWPAWLDLGNRVYRPVLTVFLPQLFGRIAAVFGENQVLRPLCSGILYAAGFLARTLADSMDAGIWLLRRTAFSEKKTREPEKRRGKRFRAATVQNITSVIDGFSFALMMTCIGIVIIIGALLWMVLETP